MIVLDASAVIDLVLGTSGFDVVADALSTDPHGAHAPHLIDVEVLQAFRRLVQTGDLTKSEAAEAIELFQDLQIERYAHTALIERAWELRSHHSAHDAMYLALTEALDATLLTADPRLVGARLRSGRVKATT